MTTPLPGDEEVEPTVKITLTGPQPFAYEAEAHLKQIIASKTSKTTQRVKDIPEHVFPFIAASRVEFQDASGGAELNVVVNKDAREISVNGDREAVAQIVEKIKASIETHKSGITSLKIGIPKRQHRLLTGNAVDDIMAKTKCYVVARLEDPTDEVTVWGLNKDLPSGLGSVMQYAGSKYIHEFQLPGPIGLARQMLTYLTRIGYAKTLRSGHSGIDVYMPSLSSVARAQNINIDIMGEKPAVDAAVRQVSAMVGKLNGATKEVSIDWLLHRLISEKYAKKWVPERNVSTIFLTSLPESSSFTKRTTSTFSSLAKALSNLWSYWYMIHQVPLPPLPPLKRRSIWKTFRRNS